MKIEKHATGLFFKLDKSDFRGDWKSFLYAVKKLPNWQYNPPEKPPDENWWWISLDSQRKFYELREKLIEDVIADEDQYRRDGYVPIPRANSRFNRKKLKF